MLYQRRSLVAVVSLDPQFLLGANMQQHCRIIKLATLGLNCVSCSLYIGISYAAVNEGSRFHESNAEIKNLSGNNNINFLFY
jgi:hypothetical protein